MAEISTRGNKIAIIGPFGNDDLHKAQAAVYSTIAKRGYSDAVLDFSQCSAAFPPPMLALCAQIMDVRSRDVSVNLILPTVEKLSRLFVNTNWAYLLDPVNHQQSRFQGYTQVPATHFTSPTEQFSAVNTIVNAVLSSVRSLQRSEFAALEWSLNELTDNVLVHAQTEKGGLVQVSMFQSKKLRIEFVVCDFGVGIPTTLRAGHPEISSDSAALEQAIREGVTRDQAVGQGNGLFGSFEICRMSGGYFQLHSGYGTLNYDSKYGLRIVREQVPFAGTLVVACIDCSQPGILQHALKFGGRDHVPVDFIETRYETDVANRVAFVLNKEATSFGSRHAGQPIRNKLNNIVELCPGKRVYVDFADIAVISSSFADEVFGKLFVALGPLRFGQIFQFKNVSETIQQLIDRAITQRMSIS